MAVYYASGSVSLQSFIANRYMEIRTLKDISIADITTAFNEAFEGYFIPLCFSEETMERKMRGEGIRLDYSVGAFEANRLVGFILHGCDVIEGLNTIYNAGTGVIPSFRGQNITEQLYRFCIPFLQGLGFCHHVLEVIDNNEQAIKVYRRIGFSEVRKLNAFKASSVTASVGNFTIKEITAIPEEWQPAYEMVAAWQNSLISIERDRLNHRMAGAFIEDELVGFGAFIPASGRIKQCFVLQQHRRKGVGTALFNYMRQRSATEQLVVTNIDEGYKPANEFLKALGFQKFLGLHEMKFQVK